MPYCALWWIKLVFSAKEKATLNVMLSNYRHYHYVLGLTVVQETIYI